MLNIERGRSRLHSADNSLWDRLWNCVIAGSRREVDEKCALLGYYAAISADDSAQPIGHSFKNGRLVVPKRR
jgi:hypothetical protein